MAEVASQGAGVTLLPTRMVACDLRSGRLMCPLALEIDAAGYWLTRLTSRRSTPATRAFRDWLLATQGRYAIFVSSQAKVLISMSRASGGRIASNTTFCCGVET